MQATTTTTESATLTLYQIADGIADLEDFAGPTMATITTIDVDGYADAYSEPLSLEDSERIVAALRSFAAYDGPEGQDAWYRLVEGPLTAEVVS